MHYNNSDCSIIINPLDLEALKLSVIQSSGAAGAAGAAQHAATAAAAALKPASWTPSWKTWTSAGPWAWA